MKEWITGRNPVYEVLRTRRRDVFRLLVATGVEEKGRLSEILKLAAGRKVPVERAHLVVRSDQVSEDLRFASAVAGFGQLLRGSRFTGSFAYDDVAALAAGARGLDAYGHRGAFLRLVQLTKSLSPS